MTTTTILLDCSNTTLMEVRNQSCEKAFFFFHFANEDTTDVDRIGEEKKHLRVHSSSTD